MRNEALDAESNSQAAVRRVEREFGTTSLIHGRVQERGGYSILVQTFRNPLLAVSQLLVVPLLDEIVRRLLDQRKSDVARPMAGR
jgi:hypothetical protein